MAKFNIPKFRYLFQDNDGSVYCCIDIPEVSERYSMWMCDTFTLLKKCKNNPNWRDTLIDLETDDYEFEDGILRRIEK